MGLTTKKEEELKKMPKVEFHVRKSKDGNYIIHETKITDIKPIAYYDKVLAQEEESVEEIQA
ncbi:MAG: hypothetical protein ACI8Y7_000747 [Candidatus Woesearchaeota archaeon]|jgi:hypothetical protein